jgi:hypothetical protein
MARRRCPAVGRRAPGRSSTNGGEDEGEELHEAATMSSISDGDELDKSSVHDRTTSEMRDLSLKIISGDSR